MARLQEGLEGKSTAEIIAGVLCIMRHAALRQHNVNNEKIGVGVALKHLLFVNSTDFTFFLHSFAKRR